MKRIITLVIVTVFLTSSCRKPRACVCTIQQPNVAAVTTTVNIDNIEKNAFAKCLTIDMTIVGTSTTTCVLQE